MPGRPSHNLEPSPVAWTPEREARGAARPSGPRCPAPSCAVRWLAGPDRPCADHAPPAGRARRAPLAPWQRDTLAYLLRQQRPTRLQRRVMTALLRDPRRSNYAVAREAQVSYTAVWHARHALEDASLIDPYRATSRPPWTLGIQWTPRQQRVRTVLLAGARRSNRVVAAEAMTDQTVVALVRHTLEDAGLIPVFRGPGGRRTVT
jgi:hypothetical protein